MQYFSLSQEYPRLFRSFGTTSVASNHPNLLKHYRKDLSLLNHYCEITFLWLAKVHWRLTEIFHASQNPQHPFFHFLRLSRGFIEPRLKLGPPCSQAMLMADFMLSARMVNFDGRRASWVRNGRHRLSEP